MSEENEKIYDSPPSKPSDTFWLAQGEKMLEDSLPSIRSAAKALMTGLGLLKAIYLGILGFSDYIPKDIPIAQKSLFLAPLVCWLVALYFSIEAIIPQRTSINLRSPDDIRAKYQSQLRAKQRSLQFAFWLLTLGLLIALLLLVFRSKFQL